MKVGVVFRGPLRPDAASVCRCIEKLTNDLVLIGIAPTVLLSTWYRADFETFRADLPGHLISHMLLLTEPDRTLIGDSICDDRFSSGSSRRNAFLQYYLSKVAVSTLVSLEAFDWIVHIRTDMTIEFGEFLPWWFSEIDQERYRTLHTRENGFINDQFGVARPEVMRRAWDYKDLQTLRNNIEKCDLPEGVLQAQMDTSGILGIQLPILHCNLDPRRHLDETPSVTVSG